MEYRCAGISSLIVDDDERCHIDPLSKLGDIVMARGESIDRVFLASVNILAGSAICTTDIHPCKCTVLQRLDYVEKCVC